MNFTVTLTKCSNLNLFVILILTVLININSCCSSSFNSKSKSDSNSNSNSNSYSSTFSLAYATELLVNNLSKFHAQFPNGITKIGSEQEEDKLIFDLYSIELSAAKNNEEIKDSNENIYFSTDSIDEIFEQLSNFSPHLVFQESWLNQLIHSFVLEHFAGVQNLADFKLFDALEITIIKFIRKELKHSDKSISDDMMFLILSFFHEMIYGIDETLPTSQDQWKIIFIQKLLERAMPNAAEYYKFLFNETIINRLRIISAEKLAVLNKQVERIIIVFSTNINKHHLLTFYDKFIEPNEELKIYAPELKFAVKMIIYETLVDFNIEEMTQFFKDLVTNFSFSQSFLDLFYTISNYLYLEFRFEQKITLKEVRMMKAIYKKLSEDSSQQYLTYLWTRDTLNPFDLDDFTKLSGNPKVSIFSIIKFNNPGLVHLNIFAQLIRAKKCNFQNINQQQNSVLLELFSGRTSSVYLKIFMAEVLTPINMFVLVENGNENDNETGGSNSNIVEYSDRNRNRKCWHIFNFNWIKLDHIKIYIENLKSYQDPLPLLFIKIDFLRQLRPLIVDKFNLKVFYKFDLILRSRNPFILSNGNLLKLETFALSNKKWKALQGKTLVFKELVDFMDVYGLIDIFTSNPSALDENESIQSLSSPISFLKFFQQGLLEPVNENESVDPKKCLVS